MAQGRRPRRRVTLPQGATTQAADTPGAGPEERSTDRAPVPQEAPEEPRESEVKGVARTEPEPQGGAEPEAVVEGEPDPEPAAPPAPRAQSAPQPERRDEPAPVPDAQEPAAGDARPLVPDGPRAETAPAAPETEATATQPEPAATAVTPAGPRRRPLLQAVSFLAAVALGIGLMSQIHSAQERGLESLSQPELLDLLGQVNGRSERLGGEVQRLEGAKRDLSGGSRDEAAAANAQARVDALGILAGTRRAHGTGMVMRVDDPKGSVRAAQVLAVVSELRDAGAEAIQINDVRVVASTWFDDKDGAVVVDGKTLRAPLEFRALGDSHTLSQAMKIPGGAEQSLSEGGRTVTVEEQPDVLVDALHTPAARRYARPVGSTTSSP